MVVVGENTNDKEKRMFSAEYCKASERDLRRLIESEEAFKNKTHWDQIIPLWDLFRRSAREGSIVPRGGFAAPNLFENMGAEPTKEQYDRLFYCDGGRLFLQYNSCVTDSFTDRYGWMKQLSKPKYKQGQTIYFKANAPVRKGKRGILQKLSRWGNFNEVEKAEEKLAKEKEAGTLANKPALVIEVPEIVPEGGYKGNRLYKVEISGYPVPVILPERCFKKSNSVKGRKKNKSNLPA